MTGTNRCWIRRINKRCCKQKRKAFHSTPTGRLAQAVPESETFWIWPSPMENRRAVKPAQLLKLLDLYGAPALGRAIREALERGTPRASSVAFLLRKRTTLLRRRPRQSISAVIPSSKPSM